jgi:hypothetical protein
VVVLVVVGMRFWLNLFSFLFVVFRGRGRVMEERKEGKSVAIHNGISFSFNELVHVWEETTPGLRPKKTEFIKAWFKGVDTEKDKFICRPVVGHSGGPFPRFAKGAVYKLKVFGVGVFEERGRRTRWERLKADTQDRCSFYLRFVLEACVSDFAFSL